MPGKVGTREYRQSAVFDGCREQVWATMRIIELHLHQYADANALAGEFSRFDRASSQTLIGEYSMQRGTYPSWAGAVAEVVFELGAEKNGDRIIGMSYATLLMNANSHQWTPDLITFSAASAKTTLSTSYHQIKVCRRTK